MSTMLIAKMYPLCGMPLLFTFSACLCLHFLSDQFGTRGHFGNFGDIPDTESRY